MDLLPWVWLVAYLRARPGRVDTGSSMFGCPRCLSVLVSDLVLFIKISRTQWWNRFNNFILYLKDIIQIWKKTQPPDSCATTSPEHACHHVTKIPVPSHAICWGLFTSVEPAPVHRTGYQSIISCITLSQAERVFFYACVRRSVGLVL
jgi:hypothetical protein